MRFALATLAWSVLFFPLWFAASQPISLATAWLAARGIELVGPVERAEVRWSEERVVFGVVPDASVRYRRRLAPGALFELAVNARKQTVGLPFFLALAAAGARRRFALWVAACAILAVLAAIGVACEAGIGFGSLPVAGSAPLFSPGVVAASAMALGYQLGTLIFPTLAPIALWLWIRTRPTPAP